MVRSKSGRFRSKLMPKHWFWIVVFAAILVRGAVGVAALDHYAADPDAYRAIAETLSRTGVFGLSDGSGEARPTAFRPPLYPFVLSWLTSQHRLSSMAVVMLHAVLGAITVAVTFLTTRRILAESGFPRCSLLAATMVMLDPILLQQSTLVMTETLATALAAVTVWWWVRRPDAGSATRWGLMLGLWLSAAFLCRPTFLVWGILLVGCIMVMPTSCSQSSDLSTKQRRIRQFGRACLTLVVIALTVAGWMLRNQRAVGHPVWATTHGGYTLLLANNPMFYHYLREGEFGTTWDPSSFFEAYSHRGEGDPSRKDFWQTDWKNHSPELTRAGSFSTTTEVEDDRRVGAAAKATIRRQPKMFLWSCLVRLARLWTPLPHQTATRTWLTIAPIACYLTLFYVAVVVGIRKLGRHLFRPAWWPIAMLVATLSLVHMIYWSNIRMRSPAIPGLAILAATAFRRDDSEELRPDDLAA